MTQSTFVSTPSILMLIVLSSMAVIVSSQAIMPMSVCHEEGMPQEDVEAFCQSVPDCADAPDKDALDLDCYMRCDEGADEDQVVFPCEDFGMVCHEMVVCVLPPVINLQEEEEEAHDFAYDGAWGEFGVYDTEEGDSTEDNGSVERGN